MKKIRCAIYTRKSAEEGLEQEFNSLDAQREACAAYVASQKAEGWVLLPTVYEDAGISGGTLERPWCRGSSTDRSQEVFRPASGSSISMYWRNPPRFTLRSDSRWLALTPIRRAPRYGR